MPTGSERPIFVFDTSALVDFASGQASASVRLHAAVPPGSRCVYHPVTLAELSDFSHPSIVAHRQPRLRNLEECVRTRRHLITLLYHHRKIDNPAHRLYGQRFLPFHPTFPYFSYLAHQRQQPSNLRTTERGEPLPVAHLTDHQILAAALFTERSGQVVVFVSGDKLQLGAAARFRLAWVY